MDIFQVRDIYYQAAHSQTRPGARVVSNPLASRSEALSKRVVFLASA